MFFVAARVLAIYLIPGCVGRGVRLGAESSPGAGAGAACAVGGVWKSGNLEIWESGNLEIWGPGNPEIWGSKKSNKLFKIQVCSAQNVGKVWISRKKILLAPFGAI